MRIPPYQVVEQAHTLPNSLIPLLRRSTQQPNSPTVANKATQQPKPLVAYTQQSPTAIHATAAQQAEPLIQHTQQPQQQRTIGNNPVVAIGVLLFWGTNKRKIVVDRIEKEANVKSKSRRSRQS